MTQDGPIFEKYIVTRTDGKSAPGQKHDGCAYFVLDLDHDPHALPALAAYARSCETTHPQLARDLGQTVAKMSHRYDAAKEAR